MATTEVADIPLENLRHFGATDRSVAVWWRPDDGSIITFAIEGELREPRRSDVIGLISKRPRWQVVELLHFPYEEEAVRIALVRVERGHPEHPGQSYLELVRDEAAGFLGWLDDEEVEVMLP